MFKLWNIIEYLFPKQCVLCASSWDYMCKTCKRKLKSHPEICPYCHKFSPHYQSCLDCKTTGTHIGKAFLEWVIITFVYAQSIKKLIMKFKYFHKKDIADFLVQRLILSYQLNHPLQQLIQKTSSKDVYITSVPSHWFRKYFVKGYNQSEILAKKFAKTTGHQYIDIAKKIKHTKSQARLKRKQRISNLHNCFHVYGDLDIHKQSLVILLDDITTSGATLNELARSIKQKYPLVKIWGIVLWRSG